MAARAAATGYVASAYASRCAIVAAQDVFQRMLVSFAQTLGGRRAANPEQRASDDQELAVLERALAQLSEKKRAVFVLVELEGLSAVEAAQALESRP